MINLTAIGILGKHAELNNTKDRGNFYITDLAIKLSKDKTQWIQLRFNESFGSKIASYLLKGTKVYVSGFPSISAYLSKDKSDAIPSIILFVDKIEILSSSYKKQSNSDNNLETDILF